jgi:hypothetical protein
LTLSNSPLRLRAGRHPPWRWCYRTASDEGLRWRLFESTCVLVIASLAYLALGELAIRIALHAPLLAWHDFRHAHAANTINNAIQYDELLGWRLKSLIRSPGFNTLEYGFRSNGDPDAHVQFGGVLAIGSSFTVGSEVVDQQSWPAHLAQLTAWNVNNAGEGGYQADQIILLGEQLLPLIRPSVLVVDLIPGTIIGVGYTAFGRPKPYFTIEDGHLLHHNFPAPRHDLQTSGASAVRYFLGHFAVVDRFVGTFFANAWFTAGENDFATVLTDEIGVTCRMLQTLKQKTDAAGVRVLLYLQYDGPSIVDATRRKLGETGPAHGNVAGNRRSAVALFYRLKRWAVNKVKPILLGTPPDAPDWYDASAQVGACARGFGIQTVDELATLKAVYEKDPAMLRRYYQIEPDGSLGHKSSFGNMAVAKLVAAAIGELQPPADQKSK